MFYFFLKGSARALTFVSLFLVFVGLFCLFFPGKGGAQCNDKDVWAVFPTTDDMKKEGLPVNEQLKTDSGPIVGTDNTKTYSRRWQGGAGSWGLSVSLIIYPDANLAAGAVQKYGEGVTKSKDGIKVAIGDLGYKINDLMRPYYMIQKKCMVITFYTSSPRRTSVGNQDAVVSLIVDKLGTLSCCSAGGQPPPSTNNCPIITRCSFSPAAPTPKDVITFTAIASDKDGDKISYQWEIWDFQKNCVKTLTGASANWSNPAPGNYQVQVFARDADPNCFDVCSKTVVVLADPSLPNQPPVIRLSVSPRPALTNRDVVITAVVTDPDNDKFRGGWGQNGAGGGRNSYPGLQRVPGSGRTWQPVKSRSGDTFTWRGRVIAGAHKMKFVAEDNRGAKADKTISFVAVDPIGPLSIILLKTPTNFYISQPPVSFKVIDNAPAGKTLTYAWTVDGNRKKNWTGNTVSWANPSLGAHTVKVQVWKKNGETDSKTASFEITAVNPPPPPKNTPPKATIVRVTAKPVVGKPVDFKVTITDPDKNDTHGVTWRINGHPLGSAKRFSWKPAAAGTFTVSVTVSDGSAQAGDSHSFTVGAGQIIPPPPPPPKRSIILKADFFHANIVFGSGPVGTFEPGEEIGLRLEVRPAAATHKIAVRWFDAARKQIRRRLFHIRSVNFNTRQIFEDHLQTQSADRQGTWTVEILVDGRFDRTMSFSLTQSRPGALPRRNNPPGGGGNRPPGPSSGQWRQVF